MSEEGRGRREEGGRRAKFQGAKERSRSRGLVMWGVMRNWSRNKNTIIGISDL